MTILTDIVLWFYNNWEIYVAAVVVILILEHYVLNEEKDNEVLIKRNSNCKKEFNS